MSSRKELKAQRRNERDAARRAALAADQRRRRRRRFGIGLLVPTVAAAVVLAITLSGRGDASESFAAKRQGLTERMSGARLKLGVDHFHPTLKVFVGDVEIPVPDDIGAGEGGTHAPLHRHAGDPKLHAEGLEDGALTLAQVMKIWGVAFSEDRLGSYRADGRQAIRVWAKAPRQTRFREATKPADLRLTDGQEVYLAYGTREQAPITE